MLPFHVRQGDILILRDDAVPLTGAPVAAEAGRLILARGEATGHHHSLAARDGRALFRPDDMPAGSLVLQVSGETAFLEHQEHAPLELPPGRYRVIGQREYHPEAVRRVED